MNVLLTSWFPAEMWHTYLVKIPILSVPLPQMHQSDKWDVIVVCQLGGVSSQVHPADRHLSPADDSSPSPWKKLPSQYGYQHMMTCQLTSTLTA